MAHIPLTIYRELTQPVPGDLADWLDLRGQLYEVEDPGGRVHAFVDGDMPRDQDITEEIVRATSGFALFAETDEGPEFVASYSRLVDAIEARQSAKVTISASVVDAPSGSGWDSLSGAREQYPEAPPHEGEPGD